VTAEEEGGTASALEGELMVSTGMIVMAGVIVFLALVVGPYIARGSVVRTVRVVGSGGTRAETEGELFRNTIEAVIRAHFSSGNQIELCTESEKLYERLFEDLENAKELITWHVYFFQPGRLADRVQEVLCERARAGVRIFVMFDFFGSWGITRKYREQLRDAGVEVARFRPLTPLTLYKVQQRSHVRSIVIDRRLGYTGGFAIDDHWIGKDGKPPWRDTSVRVVGPVVDELEAAFVASWAECTGELLTGDRMFPVSENGHDGEEAAVFYSAPSIGSTSAERFFACAIAGAGRRLYIASAYFNPDRKMRRLLCEAVERGVDVRILTPGSNTDMKISWYAARARYEELLDNGVRIFEYRPTMMHAKTITIDGVFGVVGTINFDNRSIRLNDEVALLARSRRFSEELDRSFLRDLDDSREVELDDFRKRPWGGRILEWIAVRFTRLL
jgi:cardiolipin synthase A/B